MQSSNTPGKSSFRYPNNVNVKKVKVNKIKKSRQVMFVEEAHEMRNSQNTFNYNKPTVPTL